VEEQLVERRRKKREDGRVRRTGEVLVLEGK
jgi:hypothetical protein